MTVAAILGIALVFELWWIYFDVVAIANVRRLVRAPVGPVQNELARDVYSYLHFPLVAGIELAAFGLHDVLEHPEEHLKTVPRSPCSAASRSTCSATSRSACAARTPSTPAARCSPWCCSR